MRHILVNHIRMFSIVAIETKLKQQPRSLPTVVVHHRVNQLPLTHGQMGYGKMNERIPFGSGFVRPICPSCPLLEFFSVLFKKDESR